MLRKCVWKPVERSCILVTYINRVITASCVRSILVILISFRFESLFFHYFKYLRNLQLCVFTDCRLLRSRKTWIISKNISLFHYFTKFEDDLKENENICTFSFKGQRINDFLVDQNYPVYLKNLVSIDV